MDVYAYAHAVVVVCKKFVFAADFTCDNHEMFVIKKCIKVHKYTIFIKHTWRTFCVDYYGIFSKFMASAHRSKYEAFRHHYRNSGKQQWKVCDLKYIKVQKCIYFILQSHRIFCVDYYGIFFKFTASAHRYRNNGFHPHCRNSCDDASTERWKK